MDRRVVIKSLAGALFLVAGFLNALESAARAEAPTAFRLATFSADITPPIGSPLCGGWIRAAEVIDDPLLARGVVLLGGERPIVLCALDWVENGSASYDAWRKALATAAGTDASHVAVQCVHPHNAPWGNVEANRLAQEVDPKLNIVDPGAFQKALRDTAAALTESLKKAQPITHVGSGESVVEQVASTRRVMGPDGRVAFARMSRAKDKKAREAPEGLIDPRLKTLSFWAGDKPVAALHYYATHPMSYYGDGRVSSDFCGLARAKRQADQPDVFQVYFNGCAGDITAGKYNEGTPESRVILRDRIHAGMVAAWKVTRREPIDGIAWQTSPVLFEPREEKEFSPDALRRRLADTKAKVVTRSVAAVQLTWLAEVDKPVEISCLRIGKNAIIHLPGEPFVEYQLFAQKQRPDLFVCVAGYGNGGMGYIPLKESYGQGGYEPTMAFMAPSGEERLKKAIDELLAVRAEAK